MKPPVNHSIHARGVSFSIDGEQILQDIDLHLKHGQITGLLGPNGSGKSTLLRLLAGVIEPSRGEVHFAEQAYGAENRSQRAKKIAYIPQDTTIHWPIKVERVVELGRLPHLEHWQSCGAEELEIITSALRDTDTLNLRSRTVDTLSGGERARVNIARAMAARPETILADEPTAALDPAHQISIMELLTRYQKTGASICISLHDISLAAHYCDQLILLDHGRISAAGTPDEVLTRQKLSEVYGIRPADSKKTMKKTLEHPWKTL